MSKNPKRAIWEALLLTFLVFFLGFLLGFVFESSQAKKMTEYYTNSEFYLMDAIALNSLEDNGIFDCSSLYDSYFSFADRVYNESIMLQDYEASEQITQEMKVIHRRYDLLRTFLWSNILKNSKNCEGYPKSVVYLYEYNTEDLAKKATQNVWSKVLYDLKQAEGGKIILIPIAVDLDINSLNTITKSFNVSSYPALIIGEKEIITDLTSVQDLKKYLN